ncbi:hypothetical protein DNTS_022961 [Danionella cerebrum]|uniref:ATR-interacting protein n=1 Tax=Danionella cerebrum TaxID=2873325 RepID=A0A553RHD9_9TELE|nr:hypothetical protein DNTS_022961 [Danionella translucida]
MDFPPSKRLKAQPVSTGTDPFDDDFDFTQEDLEQIDIIASQAISTAVSNPKRSFDSVFGCMEETKAPQRSGRKTFAIGDGTSTTSNCIEAQRKDLIAEGHSSKDGDDLHFRQLEEQQVELKRKLKEVEDEILMKNGEIRVLRDSLKLANQEREQQRQTHMVVEREKTQAQSERKKEFSKKVQSLQSELHFKEAEINEMRGKLQSMERGSKQPGTPARSSAQSPVSRSFLMKEDFCAEISRRTSPDAKSAQSENFLLEQPKSDRTFSPEGCVLLKLLLQQPLDPSPLGLCHLLSISSDALPQHGYNSPGSLLTTSSSAEFLSSSCPPSRIYQLQSLALSALTSLSLHYPESPARSCPPAVHFLPLLSFHIHTFCHSLESIESSAKAPLHSGSLSGASDGSLASSLEETLSTQEALTLAALKALYHILNCSNEALETILNHVEASQSHLPSTSADAQPQPPLLKRLLQLADPEFSAAGGHKEVLVSSSLMVLNVLASRAEEKHIHRLQLVLSSQVLTKNLAQETSLTVVRQCVRFLSFIVSNDDITTKVCSHEYQCLFLKMFHYVTSRPDKSIPELSWSRLELEVIRLLTKLFTLKPGAWLALCETSCQCVHEVVRTVVVLLHRQWLKTKCRRSQTVPDQIWATPGFHVLREALMLLHWLLLKDPAFSEHCLEVLHMYDQNWLWMRSAGPKRSLLKTWK